MSSSGLFVYYDDVKVHTRLGLANLLVHKRLREHGLVDLVVSVAAVAHDVDDHVFVEGRAPLRGHVTHVHYGFWVVAVHVEDRRVHYAGHVYRNQKLIKIQNYLNH